MGSTSTGGGPSTSSSGPGSNSTIGSTTVVTTSGGGSTGTGTGAGGIPTTVWYASDSDLSAASVLTAYLNTHGYQAQLSPAPVTEPSTYTGNFAVGGSLSGSSGAAWNDAGISWWTYMFHCQIYEGNIVDDTSTSLTCQGNSCGISPYFIGAPVDGPTLVWGVAANDTSAAASAYPGCP